MGTGNDIKSMEHTLKMNLSATSWEAEKLIGRDCKRPNFKKEECRLGATIVFRE